MKFLFRLIDRQTDLQTLIEKFYSISLSILKTPETFIEFFSTELSCIVEINHFRIYWSMYRCICTYIYTICIKYHKWNQSLKKTQASKNLNFRKQIHVCMYTNIYHIRSYGTNFFSSVNILTWKWNSQNQALNLYAVTHKKNQIISTWCGTCT